MHYIELSIIQQDLSSKYIYYHKLSSYHRGGGGDGVGVLAHLPKVAPCCPLDKRLIQWILDCGISSLLPLCNPSYFAFTFDGTVGVDTNGWRSSSLTVFFPNVFLQIIDFVDSPLCSLLSNMLTVNLLSKALAQHHIEWMWNGSVWTSATTPWYPHIQAK